MRRPGNPTEDRPRHWRSDQPTDQPTDGPADQASPSLARRLAWFIGLWVASVLSIGTVAYLIRLWIV